MFYNVIIMMQIFCSTINMNIILCSNFAIHSLLYHMYNVILLTICCCAINIPMRILLYHMYNAILLTICYGAINIPICIQISYELYAM